MKKCDMTLGDCINIFYPVIIAILFLVIDKLNRFTYKVCGYSNVLESIITFSSIVIGFYTTMYGIIITMKNTNLMKEIRKHNLNGIFKLQLYDSLLTAFTVLVLSIIMQVTKNYDWKFNNVFFDVWFVTIGYFAGSTYRSMSLLLKIIFADEDEKTEIHQKTPLEKKEQLEKIGIKEK